MQELPPDNMPDTLPGAEIASTNTQNSSSPRKGIDLRLISAIMGGLLIVFLIAMVALARANTPTPTAAQILANAEKAAIHDATFTMNGTLALSLGQNTSTAPSTASNISGNGSFSNDQRALQVHATVPIISAQSAVDLIVLPGNTYVKISGLPTTAGIPQQWIYVPLSVGGTVDFKSLYTSLQNVVYVDSSTINGVATWHIRGDAGGKSLNATQQNTTKSPNPQKTSVDLWIAQDTYFPVKISTSLEGNLGALSGLIPMPGLSSPTSGQGKIALPTGGTVNMSIAATFANWNKGVTITAPPADQVINVSSVHFPGLTGLGL